MKCDDAKDETLGSAQSNFNCLDNALHELGMLSAITNARQDFLRENKTNFGIMRMNSRFVSNVTLGYCMKRTLHKNRLCPYTLPLRHRTKSENSDVILDENSFKLEEVNIPSCSKDSIEGSKKCLLKKCQSLENLSATEPLRLDLPDMECVSTQIEKLQVDE